MMGVGRFEHPRSHLNSPNRIWDFNGTAAIILLSADGKFLYGSNRGHDSIAVYQILADGGSLQLVESHQWANPRDFNITPDQNYRVHQDSDNRNCLQTRSETGRLTEISHDFYVPESCLRDFNEVSKEHSRWIQ